MPETPATEHHVPAYPSQRPQRKWRLDPPTDWRVPDIHAPDHVHLQAIEAAALLLQHRGNFGRAAQLFAAALHFASGRRRNPDAPALDPKK